MEGRKVFLDQNVLLNAMRMSQCTKGPQANGSKATMWQTQTWATTEQYVYYVKRAFPRLFGYIYFYYYVHCVCTSFSNVTIDGLELAVAFDGIHTITKLTTTKGVHQ